MTVQVFIVDTVTGETVQRMVSGCSDAFVNMPLDENRAVIPYMGEEDIEGLETYLDGTLKLRPRTVDDDLGFLLAKIRLKEAIMARREKAECSGCATALGRMQTDEKSRGKVSGAVTMAIIAQIAGVPFAETWTMEDNSSVIHDADQMIAAGLAVGLHVSACHAHARTLKDAVDAAIDMNAVEEIDIESGWPT